MEILSKENKIEVEVYNALKQVIDPELGINIVDMGLIYLIKYNEENGIEIKMTLSSKGCPMGDMIMDDIDFGLNKTFPDYKHHIELVWEPNWTADFITPAGRKELGMD